VEEVAVSGEVDRENGLRKKYRSEVGFFVGFEESRRDGCGSSEFVGLYGDLG
jgi:hypothetical protein